MPTTHLAMSGWMPSYISNYFKSEKDKATDALIAAIEELPTTRARGGRILPQPETLARIQNLLALGADPNVQVPSQLVFYKSGTKVTLLTKLAYKNAPEITELLLKAGARPNDPSEIPPLFIAIEYCYEEVIKLLVAYGADVNKSLPTGQTPLLTARNCEPSVWKLLLKKGANPNQVFDNRTTFLMNTIILNTEPNRVEKYNMERAIRILVEHNTDLDFQNSSGTTALMLAAHRYDKESIRALLAYGANPNIQDKDGETALFQAVKVGVPEPVELLIHAEADLSITNKKGKTALSIAKDSIASLPGNSNYSEEKRKMLINQYDEIIQMLEKPSNIKRRTMAVFKIK